MKEIPSWKIIEYLSVLNEIQNEVAQLEKNSERSNN
jgi:hypothetical protein